MDVLPQPSRRFLQQGSSTDAALEGYDTRIAELEEECARLSSSERRLEAERVQLRQQLQRFQQQNERNVHAAEQELTRLVEEIQRSIQTTYLLEENLKERQTRVSQLEQLKLELDRDHSQNEAARDAELWQRSDREVSFHGADKISDLELRNQIREQQVEADKQRSETASMKIAVAEMSHQLEMWNRQLCREDLSDNVYYVIQSRCQKLFLARAFNGFVHGIRKACQERAYHDAFNKRWKKHHKLVTWGAWQDTRRFQVRWKEIFLVSNTRNMRSVWRWWISGVAERHWEKDHNEIADRFSCRWCLKRSIWTWVKWSNTSVQWWKKAEERLLKRQIIWRWKRSARFQRLERMNIRDALRLHRKYALRRTFNAWFIIEKHVRLLRKHTHDCRSTWRLNSLARGIKALVHMKRIVAESRRMSRRIASARLGRQTIDAWRKRIEVKRRFSLLARRIQLQFEPKANRELLLRSMSGFRSELGRGYRCRELRRRSEHRRMQVAAKLLLPEWKQVTHRYRVANHFCEKQIRTLAKLCFKNWYALAAEDRMATTLNTKYKTIVLAMGGSLARLCWSNWCQYTLWSQLMNAKTATIGNRQCIALQQLVMCTWARVLLQREQEGQTELAECTQHARQCAAELQDEANAERRATVAADLQKLELIDKLHHQVQKVAVNSVELDDALLQVPSLESAILEEHQVIENLRHQVEVLRQKCKDQDSEGEQRRQVLEDEIRKTLSLQAPMRAELMSFGERSRQHHEAAEAAEQNCLQLQQEISASRRIYAEVAANRDQRLSDLRKLSRNQSARQAQLEEAMSQQQEVFKMRQIELQRLQRHDAERLEGARALSLEQHRDSEDPVALDAGEPQRYSTRQTLPTSPRLLAPPADPPASPRITRSP
eukprot:gnl/MRDRNA2_/MRDRNA2_124362_c0_seq1.p1 gnl/MRDRNA2_/MRDRNA2_124362_c0~~gnl/MRDRNA2_/MRDRNA2_124362_c0_seq1.p1  ORF type:complete len:888 (+),score=184.84 gnl/MRDRNA2_/MRDRNA2_124362_c0_seq1:73-2736(+)